MTTVLAASVSPAPATFRAGAFITGTAGAASAGTGAGTSSASTGAETSSAGSSEGASAGTRSAGAWAGVSGRGASLGRSASGLNRRINGPQNEMMANTMAITNTVRMTVSRSKPYLQPVGESGNPKNMADSPLRRDVPLSGRPPAGSPENRPVRRWRRPSPSFAARRMARDATGLPCRAASHNRPAGRGRAAGRRCRC